MRLVSINSWKAEGDYPRRIEVMGKAIAALAPDVIAIQEDFCTQDGQTHTGKMLKDMLQMQLSCAPARLKHRLLGSQEVLSTSGLALLSKEAVVEQHVIVLPQDPRDGERICQLVKLRRSADECWLANIHLTHLADRVDLRRAQIEAILQAADVLRANMPLLLCGDFNASPDSEELAQFIRPKGRLIDAFAGESKQTLLHPNESAGDLDHIFIHSDGESAPISVAKAWLALGLADENGILPSDHCAVCADLQ
jgi:endonuclease/exonuclease/phosphatase family metal-dependent hydrolase